MSGGMQGSPKTTLKAAITAAIGNVSGGASSSGIVDELKQVIVDDNSSGIGSGSGSGSAILQQESAGTDSSSSSYGRGNRNVRSDVSEGRLTICNVIFGNDNQTGGHSNNNSNSNSNGNGNSTSGIFYRIIRCVDRLLRRWLPGYNYLRGGSGSAELSAGTGGNAPEYVSCVDASNAAELQWINEQQQQVLSEVRVREQGSSSTMTGHRNKWLTNEYLSGGITRAEFSAHLEHILQKRMHKDNKQQVLPRGHHQN
ncbi:cell wall protein IFF6-like [Drosophila madeirensis]|uniref:Cell wall protein IFF6-like n=1 Tax=Drosophila madeirensis TaxID=30013 RepID=A0AAU9FXM2_DROMD